MRIYSEKQYIVWPGKDAGVNPKTFAAVIVNGKQLRSMVKSANLKDDDIIFEATEFARVRPTRSVELIDVTGAPINEELELEMEQSADALESGQTETSITE